METGDHSGSIPLSTPDVDYNISPVTATATVVVAPQASGDCNNVEPNFTNGTF